VWLDLASWLVFVTDFVVRLRLQPRYWRTRLGVFDLVIVLLTAPWYVLPAFDGARILGLARLGRLGRVFLVSKQGSAVRELGRRLGHAALYSIVLMACAALVVRAVEPPESGYESIGDALWWSMVTFTTVGYGDLFPVTAAGRFVAILLMMGGIALIGALAGSLSSFFDRSSQDEDDATTAEPELTTVLRELQAVRAELAELRSAVDGCRGAGSRRALTARVVAGEAVISGRRRRPAGDGTSPRTRRRSARGRAPARRRRRSRRRPCRHSCRS